MISFKQILTLTALCLIMASAQAQQPGIVRGYDRINMDESADPCTDFYQYAIGGWRAMNPIPATESRWGAFNILAKSNEDKLTRILEELKGGSDYAKGSNPQLLRDFYLSVLDTAELEKLGTKPLLAQWSEIDKVKNINDIIILTAKQKKTGFGDLFGFYVGTDAKNSAQTIVQLSQGGLSLPDVDYYTKQDDKSKQIRADFEQHISNMLALAGMKKTQEIAAKILQMETDLAGISMTRTERRDVEKTYNKMTRQGFAEWNKYADWNAFFKTIHSREIEELIIAQPDFFLNLGALLKKYTIADWKNYLKWHVLASRAGVLNQALQNESFRFNSTVLKGVSERKPLQERAVNMTNGSLGEPLGKLFVERHFSPESKAMVAAMIEDLRAAFRVRIENLDWMSAETKQNAFIKLEAFTYKIGYPEKWKDYSAADINAGTLYQNLNNLSTLRFAMMMDKLGKPVDKTEWSMTPQTVNAYYNAANNEIVFPAGILQAPFFDPNVEAALNYGGIGAVIGHEFSHGFDDRGSKFDAEGNLKNWWTDDDRANFEQRTKKIVEQFNRFEVIDGVFINGSLTQGENIADLAGLTLAYYALKRHYETRKPAGNDLDGFTWQQRIFMGWALVWAQNISEKELRNRIITDPHSPGEYRVKGPLANMPEFWEAFGCKPTDPMVSKKQEKVEIW